MEQAAAFLATTIQDEKLKAEVRAAAERLQRDLSRHLATSSGCGSSTWAGPDLRVDWEIVTILLDRTSISGIGLGPYTDTRHYSMQHTAYSNKLQATKYKV